MVLWRNPALKEKRERGKELEGNVGVGTLGRSERDLRMFKRLTDRDHSRRVGKGSCHECGPEELEGAQFMPWIMLPLIAISKREGERSRKGKVSFSADQ